MTPTSTADVSTPSGERNAMDRDLQLINDIRGGATAIRARSTAYLPKYEQESSTEYSRRVEAAPWRPIFADSLRSLASKPFGQDVTVAEDTPERLAVLVDDIDGRGNNLTRFARHVFTEAIANGLHAVLVDFPSMKPSATLADEKAIGARPYWIHVPATDIIALRTEMVGGREIISHFRFKQTLIEPDGFGETAVEQIMILEPGLCQIWQQQGRGPSLAWVKVAEGETRWGGKTLTEVPVALLFTGDRLGSLQTRPPLRDLADVQVELYRALSRQDEILTYSGSPMLAAIGLSKPGPEEAPITVGPKTILFAPATGASGGSRWEYVAPAAAALGEIRAHVTSIIDDMRRLGMQPTMPQSGDQTATAAAINASQAHSALQAWALALKDCLEHAFTFTANWMAIDHATTVSVFTDFAGGDQSTEESKVILAAEKERVISKQTAREELRRRNILGPSFDSAIEEQRLAEERLQPDRVDIQERINVAVTADPADPLTVGTDGLVLPAAPLPATPPASTTKRRVRARAKRKTA